MTSLERCENTVSGTGAEAALASDLLGAGRLIVDAVTGATDLVESMHRTISGLAPIVGPRREGRTRGLTGLVYRSVRGVSRLVGSQLDFVLPQLVPESRRSLFYGLRHFDLLSSPEVGRRIHRWLADPRRTVGE